MYIHAICSLNHIATSDRGVCIHVDGDINVEVDDCGPVFAWRQDAITLTLAIDRHR